MFWGNKPMLKKSYYYTKYLFHIYKSFRYYIYQCAHILHKNISLRMNDTIKLHY